MTRLLLLLTAACVIGGLIIAQASPARLARDKLPASLGYADVISEALGR